MEPFNRIAGESDIYFSAYHASSKNFASDTTPLLLEPDDGVTYLVTRVGFTVYDPASDFTQEIKLDYNDGNVWETRFLADNYASLSNVADRVDSFKIGTVEMVAFLWHYRNSIKLIGSKNEAMKIYPSAVISNCDKFYCSMRYLKYTS